MAPDGARPDTPGTPAMTASTFDTLAVARELKAAGIEAGQAEAIAAQIRAAAIAGRDELATKGDLAVLRSEFATLRGDLYRALWIQGAGIVVILTALRFLPI